MRKMMSATLMMCMVALLSTLSISAVHATRPTAASGIWEYTPTITGMRPADGNMFIEATSDDTLTGTIVGEGHSVDRLVVHEFVSFTETGFWYAEGLLTLDPCTVAGKSGTLIIRFVGKGTAGQWSGQWVILSGTDGLANLRGQGTWWGPEVPGGNTYPYSGHIHFD